ncbi:hypothetical protein M5D96_013870 [Drosophila gunungcola]|uniref:Uncharacterized protein n=1 Tax=Drosophila gunungcola TaxID=103775 RepID=A0A9P9YB68_9MUSC|nr:hypothetical protein M5D96_013870 [Drosophila gunungcola]
MVGNEICEWKVWYLQGEIGTAAADGISDYIMQLVGNTRHNHHAALRGVDKGGNLQQGGQD